MIYPYQRIVQKLRGQIAISIQKGNAIAILANYSRSIKRSVVGGRERGAVTTIAA